MGAGALVCNKCANPWASDPVPTTNLGATTALGAALGATALGAAALGAAALGATALGAAALGAAAEEGGGELNKCSNP